MSKGSITYLRGVGFTHKLLPLELVGKFHIDPDFQKERLAAVKTALGLKELMYLSTCNRVEFVAVSHPDGKDYNAADIIHALQLDLSEHELQLCSDAAHYYHGDEAVKHLFEVSASLDSMVIGEREIITQVRKAYEDCKAMGLTGDLIRLVMRKTIETAKEIFTETDIFKKPVSVVSLGFHRLREMDFPPESRVLMIGAGKTNRAMAKFMVKHGFKDLAIFNRSIERAEELSEYVGGKPYALDTLKDYKEGFDVMITCTASSTPMVEQLLFEQLQGLDTGKKVIIDLAIPADISPEVVASLPKNVRYINIEELKQVAEANMAERAREIDKCQEIIEKSLIEFHSIYRQRELELHMRDIPLKVKEIKENALAHVYAKEIGSLDPASREVLDKVMAYMEKKYISVPMKMAREVILNKSK
jgi:glutamyl-tRNA reductase